MRYKNLFQRSASFISSALVICSAGMASASDDTPSSQLSHDAQPLTYIEPRQEAVSVGKAGDNPANIARYLMARGAGPSKLSPEGQFIAFRSNVTGKRQLWIMPVEGGQAQQLTFGNGVTFFEWSPLANSGDADTLPHLIYGADNNGDEQESGGARIDRLRKLRERPQQ